jgi:transposase
VSAPAAIRTPLEGLGWQELVSRCAAFRVDDSRIAGPAVAVRAALRPRTTAVLGVGAEVAGQMLVTAEDNPDRLRSEAAFAHLCAAVLLPPPSPPTCRLL